jgi:hypothetical protein
MSTGQIAFIGEPKADRKTTAARVFHHLGPITYRHNNPPTARCSSTLQRLGSRAARKAFTHGVMSKRNPLWVENHRVNHGKRERGRRGSTFFAVSPQRRID